MNEQGIFQALAKKFFKKVNKAVQLAKKGQNIFLWQIQ